MVGTFQALGLLLVAVVPGAVLTFSYERHVGPLAGDTNDRILRFVVGTAFVFPITARLASWTYTGVIHVPTPGSPGGFENHLVEPTKISLWWTLVPILYVLAPWLLGWLGGHGRVALWRYALSTQDHPVVALVKRMWPWSPPPANRTVSLPPGLAAWDVVFFDDSPKLIAAKLRGGTWIAGFFGDASVASPPAAKEKEMLLEYGLEVDETGTIVRDENHMPVERPGAVVVKYEDVELMIVESD